MIDLFINNCDDLIITEESSLKYKIMRKTQTNKIAINIQIAQQKKLFEKKINECTADDEYAELWKWCNKQIATTQRKINGNEIKNKNDLKKMLGAQMSMKYNCESKIKDKSYIK